MTNFEALEEAIKILEKAKARVSYDVNLYASLFRAIRHLETTFQWNHLEAK